MPKHVLVLGSFVADLAFRSTRLPAWGETLMGTSFALGPGGKGSNQAVAAARAGAPVRLVSKVGADAFGELARETWKASGIDASQVITGATATGAAAILLDAQLGENAILVVPGACFTLTPAEVDAAADAIRSAAVFLTQLELPLATAQRGLEIARAAGVPTILNPAPAPSDPLSDAVIALADFLIPNETEAALLTGIAAEASGAAGTVGTSTHASAARLVAERQADALLARGARAVILTLGAGGSLLRLPGQGSTWIPPFNAGTPIDTAGAGDAFCGAFAAALATGKLVETAARFASAAAGISVTRAGTADAMPNLFEIEALLAR